MTAPQISSAVKAKSRERVGARYPGSEIEELLAQRAFVFLLRSLHLAANFVLLEMRFLPLIDFGDRMIDRRQRFLVLDRSDPALDGRFVGVPQLIELRSILSRLGGILLHFTPLSFGSRSQRGEQTRHSERL